MTPQRPTLDLTIARGALRKTLPAADKAQLWARIEAHLPRPEREGGPATRAQSWALRWMVGVVLIALGIWWGPSWLSKAESGPLVLEDGRALGVEQALEEPRALLFADGSHVALAPHARIEALAMTGDQVLLKLAQGSARFEVKKGGPRSWRIEAGLLSVEVVGTRFWVERSAARVRVAVSEGRVLVRSSWLTDGVARLDAGQEVVVEPTPALKSTPQAPSSVIPPSAEAKEAQPHSLLNVRPSATRPLLAELQAAADEARRNGDQPRTQTLLQDIVRLYPTDPAAALSSFALGRLHQRQGRWAEADRAYVWALEHGAAGPLREDCTLRRVEVLSQLNPAAATRVGEQYLQAHPTGRHRARIEQLLAPTRASASSRPSATPGHD